MSLATDDATVTPPQCGACGYDTTGLTSLTCPECGADLRIVGIRRGRTRDAGTGFVVSLAALLLAWSVCGFILAAAVSALVPERRFLDQSLRLSGPASGAYAGVDVAVHATGWDGAPLASRVELQLVPLASRRTPDPPPPLSASYRLGAESVLAWMSRAGIDAGDARVREEAQAVAMSALRGLRTRERYGAGGFTSSAVSSGMGGPFASVTTTMRAGGDRPRLPVLLFWALWFAVLVAAVRFLWHATRRRSG